MLFRSENAVAGITEAGANVGSLVQAAVQMPDINLDIGVCVVQFFQAFGSGDDAHELNLLATVFLYHADGIGGRPASRKHGVHDYDLPLVNRVRELALAV